MKIKSSILLAFFLLSFVYSGTAQAGKSSKTRVADFKGMWMEYWSYDAISDVKYNDSFRIEVAKGKPQLFSVGGHFYEFKRISLVDGVLSFDLINQNYILPYRLKLNKTKDALYGTAMGIDKKTVNIKWEKISDPYVK